MTESIVLDSAVIFTENNSSDKHNCKQSEAVLNV